MDKVPCDDAMSHSKYQHIDFTVRWLMDAIQLIVHWPKGKDQQQTVAVERPFQPMVRYRFKDWLDIV